MTDGKTRKIGDFPFDPEIIDTLGWLANVRAYLEEMEVIIPQARERAATRLSEKAKVQNWSDEILMLEDDILESRFNSDFPLLLRYSVVVLLHTIVETQLFRLANYFRKKNGFSLKVTDFRSPPLNQAKLYFTKVANVKITDDPVWENLKDLAKLRDIIVHRGGDQGVDSKQQETVKMLSQKYKGEISLIGPANRPDSEIEISSAFCRKFLDLIDEFFDRLFVATDLK